MGRRLGAPIRMDNAATHPRHPACVRWLLDWCFRICGILTMTCVPGLALGQIQVQRSDVLASPQKIVFSPWQEVAQLENGTEYLEIFPSPVQTGDSKNDSVPLRVYMPNGATGPVPVVLVAHYLGATDLKAEAALASDLNERGLAAAIITLPYHLERTPAGSRSGLLALRPDPGYLAQFMYQSQQDARRSMDFLDSRAEFKHDGYGFAGISLGALVAALTAATDERVRFATFALGGADFAHILWQSSLVRNQKALLRQQGWTETKLARALSPIEPLSYLPRSSELKSLVIEAKFDSVMPRSSSEELVKQLKSPQILKIETGHYGGVFVQSKLLRTIAEFFSATMKGQPYTVASRFSALTLRLGGIIGAPQGVDLGAGVDLFHLDPSGNRFGTIFLTPRGVRFFLGQQIGYGFAIGALGSPKGLGVGLMWSLIL